MRTILSIFLAFAISFSVEAQPSFSKNFSSDEIGPGSVSTLTFTITNGSASGVTDLAFTDLLPVGVTIADPASAIVSNGSGTLSAPDGGGIISFSGGTLGASMSMTISVNVTSSTSGTHTNTSGDLTSSAGNSGSSTDDLTVSTSLPGFSKSFSPSSVPLGGTSTLTFIIDNTANTSPVPNLDFTDNLPLGMVIANPANASTTCGTALVPPTLTANAGGNVVILDSNGTSGFPAVAAGASCIVTVDIKSIGIGELDNVSDELLAEFDPAGKATATLEVTRADLHIQKDFIDDPTPSGGIATLDFLISNFDRDFAATAVAFSDDLTTALAGLTFSSLISNGCGGTVTGLGTTMVGLTGGTIAPQSNCVIRIECTVPIAASPGVYTNTSGTVSGTVGGSPVVGNTASNKLFVEPVPILTKEYIDDPVGAGNPAVLRFTIENTSITSSATDIEFYDDFTDLLGYPVMASHFTLPATPCGPGSSIVIDNSLPGNDRGGLSLTGGLLDPAPSLTSSCTFDVTLNVPSGTPQGLYPNTTSAISATVDGATRIGTPASDDLQVIAAPILRKEFLNDPVQPGSTVDLEFTLEYGIAAPGDATAITFTDDLAATVPALPGLVATGLPIAACGGSLTGSAGDTFLTFSGGSIMPGETCSFTVTLNVPAGASIDSYTNTTSAITATVLGESTSGNPAVDDLDVTSIIFSKVFLTNPVIPGDVTTLRFTITNNDAVNTETISFFSDDLDAMISGAAATGPATFDDCGGTLSGTTFLTYSGGSVMPSSSCTIEVPVLIPGATADDTYSNITSSLSTSAGTVNPAVNTLEVNSTLIEITKSFTDDPVQPGNPVTVEYTLSNLDASNAISMIDFSNDFGATLAGLIFDSVLFNDCGGTAAGTGTDMLTYTGGSLAAGGSCTIRLSITTPASAPYGGSLPCATSDVTGDLGGFAVRGDAAADNLDFQLLDFDKTVSVPNIMGEATIMFTITNPDPANSISNINFNDDLESFITGTVTTNLPMSNICGNASSVTGNSIISFNGGELGPSSSCSFTVDILIPNTTAENTTYDNTTSPISANGLESDPATFSLFIPTGTFCSLSVTCPMNTDLGSYDCTELGNIPAEPTDEATAVATPYNIVIDDNHCGDIVVQSVDDITVYDVCTMGGQTVTRTVTVFDDLNANSMLDMGEDSQVCIYTFTIEEDVTPPIITCPGPIGPIEGCDETAITAATAGFAYSATPVTIPVAAFTGSGSGVPPGTVTENCGAATATYVDLITDDTCPNPILSVTRSWTVTDNCGNTSSSCTQIITVEDTTPPTISCPNPDMVECIEDVPPADIMLVMSMDNCMAMVTVTHEGDVSDGMTCAETITRTYRATDACGNSTECTQTITVDDVTDPTPVCNAISVTLDDGTYDFTTSDIDDIGAGSTDNCGTVTLAINETQVDCDDAPSIEVILTVTDMCDNTSTCTATVNIEGGAPDLTTGTYGPICNNQAPITLIGTPAPDPGDTAEWTGTGVTDPSNTDATATFDPAGLDGTYTVTYTFNTAEGCESMASTEITVFDSPMLTISSCMCGYDPNIDNFGSLVNYSVAGGTAPYTVTTTFGILENSSPTENSLYNLYLGAAGGSYTITVVDDNGCSNSFSSSCDNCFFEAAVISDPCSCNNDQSYNGAEDGTFKDVVEIAGPGGLNLIVGAGSTGMSVPVGTPIPQVAPGLYRIMFDHVDLIGYTLLVEGVGPNGTFPIRDASGNQITSSNTCQYPVITEPNVDMVAFCNNGTALQFTGDEVTEINGFDGTVQVYVGSQTFGDLVTEFDPTLYANGVYTLTFVFNGDFVSNTGTPANPGFPGCTTSTSIEVGVGGGGALSCNDNVNVTVNNDCELDFSWYTLLEADAIPNVFNAVFTDSAGNIIAEDDLGNYVGSSLTYSIEDLCNGNSCWGTINIEDKSIPTILCDCPVGGEDLDGNGTIDGYSEDCTLSCYELPLLKERYWDNLRDDLVPEDVGDFIDDNVTSVCDDVLESDVSYFDVYEDLGCEGALMRRTWTVNYNKGNGVVGSISCTREYYFQPVGLETIDTARIDPLTGLVVVSEDSIRLPFPLVEMDCGADISPAGIAAYFDDPSSEDQDTDDNNIDPDELDVDCVIESNEGIVYAYPHYYIQGRNPSGPHAQAINTEICNLIVAYVDQEIEACAPGCAGNRKILRNWTVLDWCIGEFIQYGQIIKSVDQGAPIIEVNDISVSVDPWKCSADVMLPHPEHLRDGCDGDLTYWIGFVEGGLTVTGNATDGYVLHDALEGESVTVEYYTEDCCGNRTSTTIEVVVVDLTPPVPVTKEFIVISLVNIGNPEDEEQGIAKLFAMDVDNGSYDGCTGVTVEIRRAEVHCLEFDADTLWGDHVKFCCDDLDGQAFVEIDVEFRVTDEYGNVNYAWATVRLEDKSSPTQICPPDMVLTCDMDYNDFTMTGLPQAFSACGEIDLECDPNELIEDTEPRRKGPNDGFFNNPLYDGVEVPAYDPSCGFGAVRRQFASCASCVQWFVIEPIDAFDPSTIVWPSDQTVDCDDFDTGEPSWEESVCNLVGVTLSSDTFLFEDGACFKILNHWSIINWCIYDASNPNGAGRYNHTQLIKIIDTQDPEMMVEDSLCFAVDIDCVSKGVQLSGSATDEGECGSDWLKWEVTIDLNSNWDLDYYYATALPRLVNGVPNPYHIAPTGNGELATITLPDGIASSKVWHRAVWRTYDGCGNNISTVRYFQITDKKPPTPYCLNLSTAVMSGSGTVELWAIDFNVGSFDNCTAEDNLLFTFTDVAPPPRDDSEYDSSSDLMWYNGTFWYYNSETGEYEDQDDYGDEVHRWEPGLRSAGKIFTVADADASGFAQIPIYVWDECGNRDFCLVNLRLIDNMGVGEGRISGQVATETGEEVESVMTELMGASPEYPVYNMTNSAGEYAFYNVPFNTDYEVSGTRTDDYLNGVSTLDLLLIQRHILGNQSLDSPYKMIAADANNDKNISAVDLIELRKLILGIYSELPQNASWKVVDSDQTLSTVNPWIYSESLSIADLQMNMTEEDFIGVKIGDVNNSASANARGSETTEERGVRIELSYNDTYVKQGDIVEIQMSGNTNEDIYGYQFTMSTSGLELMEVRGERLDNSNVAVFANAITMSYNDVKPLNNDEIFTLVFKATVEGKVSDIINVNSTITQAEAYVGEELKVVSIDLEGTEQVSEFALYQNQPNPFSEYTVISFNLPSAEKATLKIYDMTGRILKVLKEDFNEGINTIKVSKEDLNTTGVIYYQIETENNIATKHMLLIK